MAWNEPNNNKPKDQDPWGGGKQPPDLDEVLRKIQQKFNRFMNRKNNEPRQTMSTKNSAMGLGLLTIVLIGLWIISGVYIVDPAEQSVVLRFGKYYATMGPGPHWIPRFIDTKYIVNVQKVSKFTYAAQMLTKDENIVSVTIAIQYRINNPQDYLFNGVNSLTSIQQATASALRQVIGQNTLDDILTVGRQAIRSQVETQLAKILTFYKSGIEVNTVALQSAKAPDEVKAAFDDAIKAQEDEQRYINQAQAYARGVEPIAEGQAKRIFQEAEAYKERVILQAKGSVSGFLALLPEYSKASQVTKQRLYIETLEAILSRTTKVFLDVNNNSNIINLPFDRLRNVSIVPPSTVASTALSEQHSKISTEGSPTVDRPSRESYPSREEDVNDSN